MKNWKMSIATLVLTTMTAMVFGQGSLTPPGAPAPTMKTLDQVEPRTPISSLPYTITESGSYYLTANLASTGHGVVITASGVTLDLMGFTLSGDRDSADYGVYLNGATNSLIENVVVKNGIVRDFNYGIKVEHSQGSRLEHLISSFNFNRGIYLTGQYGQCNGNTIDHCTFAGNGSIGITLSGNYGQCKGNVITDCTIRGNGRRGIYLHFTEGNRVEGNHITGHTGTSSSYGIDCVGGSKNFFFRNTCVGQDYNFSLNYSDVYGPIVTSSGALPTTGAGAHPLANFSF